MNRPGSLSVVFVFVYLIYLPYMDVSEGARPNMGWWKVLPGSYLGFEGGVSPGALPRTPWNRVQREGVHIASMAKWGFDRWMRRGAVRGQLKVASACVCVCSISKQGVCLFCLCDLFDLIRSYFQKSSAIWTLPK